ncbi:helix-turn-helix domain-containing protein [Streptomyces sp. NBC_00012]|uniref:helix-turn-helix transcriptional regulator n=1 Tax=Streptomyces sp. NBC_00012 TaxID=2975621 RepID=UPI003252C85A
MPATRVPCKDCGNARIPLAKLEDIAEYCGVPQSTVYRWSSRGDGPKMIKIGRHIRARWADIDAWLDAKAKPAAI